MEVKIGIRNASRELVLETNEDIDTVEKQIADALSTNGTVALTDTKGRRVLVPVAHLAYVELGSGVAGHVGFRS